MTTTTTPQVLLPGQGAAPEGPVDLINMYLMHHAFRRDLTAFRRAVVQTAITDRARWRALRKRWQLFSSALHHHHAAEDAGLWPLLLERASGAGDSGAREVLDAMQAEHARIDPLLEECSRGFARLAEEGVEAVRQDLRRALDDVCTLLDGHLGHEERDAMVILQCYLNNADWARLEKKFFAAAYSLREVLPMVPWVAEGLPSDVRNRFLVKSGLPVKLLWHLRRRPFARQTAAAFGRE